MNRSLIIALLLWGLAWSEGAQETNAPGRQELQSFRIISERNIFDPNRSSRADRAARREREPERRVRTESLSLVGIMSYEKGWFAFFDGSNSDYRKALQPNDAIAGYKIAEIAPNHVKLQSSTNQPVELRVGMQMKRQDEGEWEVSRPAGPSNPTRGATVPEAETNAASSAGESDVIQRLMQQREKELQK